MQTTTRWRRLVASTKVGPRLCRRFDSARRTRDERRLQRSRPMHRAVPRGKAARVPDEVESFVGLAEEIFEAGPQVEQRLACDPEILSALGGDFESSFGRAEPRRATGAERPSQATLRFEPLECRVKRATRDVVSQNAFELAADLERRRLVAATENGQQDAVFELAEQGAGHHDRRFTM